MPSILLQTDQGAMAGFLRIAGDDPLAAGPAERSCVLSGVPGEPTLFDPPLHLWVYRWKQREVRLSRTGPGCWTARFTPELALRLELEGGASGRWGFEGPGAPEARGACLTVPERAAGAGAGAPRAARRAR